MAIECMEPRFIIDTSLLKAVVVFIVTHSLSLMLLDIATVGLSATRKESKLLRSL